MAQYLTLPNGNYVEVPDGVSYDEALARAQQKFPEAFKAPEAKRTGLGAALSKGLENVISSGRTGIEALLGSPEEAARRGLERGQTMAEKYPEQVSLEKVKKAYEERGVLPAAGEAISQVPAALAEQAPNMAATIAGAQAGQRLGGMFGPAGRLVGAGLGAAVPGLTQMFGSNIERQAAEQEKEGKPISINRGAAGAAALPQAALDVVSQYIPLGSKLVSKLVGIPEAAFVSKSAAQVQKLADERLYATLAKGLGVGVMAEVPTEVAQQMLERAQAGLSLTSPDALKEYGETAYQVALLAPLGAAGRTFQRSAARSDIRQKQEDAVAEERSLQALEQEKATQALVARRGTDDYAREIEQKYKDLAAKQLEYETISKSKVADDDLLGQQAKRDARKARQALMTSDEFKDTLAEYSKLKTSGIYDKLAEQDRIAGMTPQEYALEGTQSVTSSKTKAVAPDLEGYYEQQILAPGAVDTKPALDYAKQQLALVDEHFYGAASAEQIIEYLAHNPKLASQIVNYKIRLPGMSVKDSRDTLNDLKQLLDERQTQATAQGRAGTDLNKARLNTVEEEEAAALEDQRQMRQAYEMQQEGRNATDIESIQGQKSTVQQGELFGGGQQRINMPQTGTRADMDAQIADLEKQLDVARAYGAPDAVGRRSNRERVSSLLEQIRDLKERQTQMASGAPMGGNTDAVRAYIAAGTPDRAPNETIDEWYARTEKVKPKFSNLPEQEAARREAVAARDEAYAQLQDGVTSARQDVLDNLVKEIIAARGKLRPETITQIERQANGLIDSSLRYKHDPTPAFEALAARWRAGTQTGAFGAAQAVPTTTTQDMLLTQMDAAFGKRERYDPQTLSILDQIAQNFGAVSANEDRRNMVGEWLNRVSTTGRSSPEMTRDVQAELAELERAKVSETETPTRETAFGLAAKPTQTAVQQELGAEFMPEQVSPQSATRIVDGKVQYVAPEDRGPLQGSSAERYAPMQRGAIFESFEELNKYLASDYLKAARQEMGITRQTVARLGLQVKEHEAKIANITKQVDALKERKAKLAESEAAESKAAKNIVADAEVRLEAVLNRLSDELEPLRITYMQARSQVEQIAQRSEETSRLVADNIVNFKNMDDRAVEAAQETAKAKTALLQARNKLGSLAEKLPGIQTAQQKVIEALQRQRNPLLNESQQKLQDLQKQLSKARVVQPRTVARLQQEIAELQDLMDTQRVNPYSPSAAFITFLNNDLQLQLDAQEESRKMDNAARALLRAGLDLEIAAKDLDADISQHPEILAIKKEIGTAKTLAFDALRGINKELSDIDREVEKAESAKTIEAAKAQNIEDEILATSESRGFAAQMANVPIEPMSAAERDRITEQDRKRMEAFQESTDRLEAIPGQRIDFSKRQELLELAALTEKDFNELDAFIEEMEEGVETLEARDSFLKNVLADLQNKQSNGAQDIQDRVTEVEKKISVGQERLDTLRKSIEDFTKSRVRKEAAVVAAKRVTSSDPEVYAEVTKIITARSAKLERTIDKKQANLVKKGQEITKLARDIKAKDEAGKTSPEQLTKMRARLKTLRDSQTDRAKGYKEFLKERAVLQAQQSNRLGIVRTDVLTGKSVAGDRTKKAGVAEQEEFDAEVDRVQELGRATDRLAVLEKALAAMQKAAAPKTKAKQAERAEKLAKLQADINTQQALIDSLQPRQKGKVSQAARVQSAAPSKLRAGTPESKENPGVTRQPIVEKRTTAQPTPEQAVADANAFAESLVAAQNPNELIKKLQTETATQKLNVLQGIKTLIADFRRNISRAELELQPLLDAAEEEKADLGSATFIKALREKTQPSQNEKGLVTYHGVDLDLKENGDNGIYVSLIRTNDPKDLRKGKAARALVFLKRLADTHNVTLTLRAEPVGESGMSAKQLENWYEREGFTSGDAGMYRNPETSGKRISELRNIIGKNNLLLYRAENSLVQAEAEAYPSLKETAATGVVFRTSGRGAGMDVDVVQQAADEVRAGWTNVPEIVVVQNESGLPSRLHDEIKAGGKEGQVPGLYDPDTKTVYLIADNLHSFNDVALTVAHEVAGHFGLREMLGSTYSKTMQDIYAGNPAVKEAADAKQKASPALSKDVAVEEVLADMAEQGPYANSQATNALRRIFFAIKQWFQSKLGIKNVTDSEVKQLVANARRYVKKGLGARGGAAQAGTAVLRTADPTYANTTLAKAGAAADKAIAKQRGFMDTIKEEGSGLKLMTQFVDRFAPLEKLSKYMDSLKGLQMMYYTRMYDQRMNFVAQSVGNGALQLTEKKRADGRTERIVESVGGASLKGVINVLKKGNDLVGSPEGNSRLFSMYLVAKRAERVGLSVLNYGGKVTEADLKDVREAVANTPGLKTIYEQAQREYNMYNRDMLQFAVESGAISAKTRETLIQAGDYVPYYRERNGGVDMMLGNQTISRIGNTKEQPYLKELTGGDEPILDFMTSAVQNTNMLTDMSLRNLATKNAVFELQELGMATIGKGDSASGTNVVKFKDKGEDKFAMLNTDDVVVGGKRFPTGIPADLLVKGMAGIPTQNTILTKLLGGPARILRKSVVLNPLYAAKQLFRDSLAAPLLSGADFAPVFGALKEIGKASGKTLEQRGITGGQVFTGTQEDLAMVLRDMAANKSGWAQGLAQLESMSMEADALTRRAQYNSYIKQGLSEMEATYMALESMNFSKRGMSPAVHTLATVIPFFNAQIQSMNVLFKAFSGNMPFNEKLKIREKLYQRGMLIAGMTMTYAALMQDDEGYQNATPEQKYASWFIRVPGFDESVRIPIPFEIGYIFKAIPEAIVNSMMNQDGGEEAAKAFKQIALQIIPGGSSYGMPQAIKPLLEAGLGKSFYTGRDLESAHEKTLEPGQRYRETTTELAKLVGKTVGVSPIKIDSLIQGYFSATGLALVDTLSFAIPTETGPAPATKRLSEMRLVGSLFQPNDASGIINATYDRLQEAGQVKATYQDMLAKGRVNEAQRYLQENLNAYAESGLQTSFKSYMQNIMKSENAIRASSMPPDEKRRVLDELKQQKIAFAKTVREQSDRTRLQ